MEASAELETIKWLLVAILACGVLVALSAMAIAMATWFAMHMGKEQNSGKVFRALAEDHLSRNKNEELVEYANERLESHPQDVWAHWYLGQAKFHTGHFPDSKRCFQRVLELEPSWFGTVDSWIERVDQEIEKGPKLVE